MATIKPHSKMIDAVRAWRNKVADDRRALTPEQLAARDRKMLEDLGLAHLLAQPEPAKPLDRTKKAG